MKIENIIWQNQNINKNLKYYIINTKNNFTFIIKDDNTLFHSVLVTRSYYTNKLIIHD